MRADGTILLSRSLSTPPQRVAPRWKKRGPAAPWTLPGDGCPTGDHWQACRPVVRTRGPVPWPPEHLLEDGRGYLRAILVGTMACRTGVDVLLVPSARDPNTTCAVCFLRHRPTIEVRSTEADALTIP